MQKKLWKRFFVLWAVLLFAAGFSLTAEAADKKVTLVTDGGGSVEVTVYKSDGTTADFTKKLSKDGTSDMTVTVGRKISLKFLPVTADGFATLTFDVLDGDGKAIGRNSKNQYTIPDSDVTIKAVFGKRVYKVSATGFKAPAAGETPVQKEALTSGTPDKYSVGSIKWFYGDTPEEDKEFTGTGTFDAHKKWRAEITFTTAYPYAFSGNPNATEWEWKLNETNTLIDIEASKKKMAGKFYEIVLCTVVFPGAFFDANGGTGTMQPVFAVKGQEITLPENSFTAPEGKVFNGWDLGAAGSKITVNDITAVKAQWKATVHKVTFDANGGTGTMAEVTGVEYGTSYKLPANAFTAPAGKEFDKWDQGAAGASITIKGDVVLKAVWKDISAAGDPAASETKDPAASDGTPSGDQKEAPADTTGMSDASYVYFGGDAVTPQKTKTASTVNKNF